MSATKGAMLLLLLAIAGTNAAPGPEDCDGLNVTIAPTDLHKVTGDWALVWGMSYPDLFQTTNLETSHVELRMSPDNTTASFVERNLFTNGTCTKYDLTMAVRTDSHKLDFVNATEEKNGVVGAFNDNATMQFFQTCDDCMTMLYKGLTGDFLLIYRREGQHLDLEKQKESLADNRKLAGCLGIKDKDFIFNGNRDFCHKKFSEEATPQP